MTNLPEPRCQDGSAFNTGTLPVVAVTYDVTFSFNPVVLMTTGTITFAPTTEKGWAWVLDVFPEAASKRELVAGAQGALAVSLDDLGRMVRDLDSRGCTFDLRGIGVEAHTFDDLRREAGGAFGGQA